MEFYRVETIEIVNASKEETLEAVARIRSSQDIDDVRIKERRDGYKTVLKIRRKLELLPDTLKALQGS